MEIKVLCRKFIRPSSPTPHVLRKFHISFTDEMSPTMNVPLILYYFNSSGRIEETSIFKQSLETSLARILPQFYPLCGRYIQQDRLIDCADQGVEYFEAQVNCPLHQVFFQGAKVKPEVLNDLLPCPFGAADEVTDPMLSIQVSSFECGGLAIGICVSHRISDAATLSTFVSAWANACSPNQGRENILPVFNSAHFFPSRNLPKLGIGIPRTVDKNHFNDGSGIFTRTFVFSGPAISRLRSKFKMMNVNCEQQATRVQLVSGLILSALLANDRATHGCSRASLVLQAVNFRSRTCPPIPKHSCGNFCLCAMAQCTAEQTERMEFEDWVNVVGTASKKAIANCAKILDPEIDGHMVVINPLEQVIQTLSKNSDLNAVILNSWCRFPFYDADFGWGKPSWVSVASLFTRNSVLMMDTRDGDGIEAWVTLDENGMSRFQQDQGIQTFAT